MTIIHGKLATDWPWVRTGIEKIRERDDAPWLAEDLYCQVKLGAASLYVNEARTSFGIMRPITDAISGEIGIEIVCAYAGSDDSYPALMNEIDAMAREAGARYVQMASKWKGFSRMGWGVERIIYRREV